MKKPKLRITEYIIMDSKKNKDLLTNDIIKLQKVKHKGPPNDKPPKPKPPVWFVEFSNNVYKRFDQQEKFNKFIANEVKNLKSDISAINNRLNKLDNNFNRVVKLNNLKTEY